MSPVGEPVNHDYTPGRLGPRSRYVTEEINIDGDSRQPLYPPKPGARAVRQPGPNDPVDNAEVKAALARVQRDADRGVTAHSVKDQFAERLLHTLDVLQNSPERWRLSGTWLVEEVDGCTCGSPLGPYPHEPQCGLEPIICLEGLPGWGTLVAEIKAQVKQEMILVTEETDPNGGDTVARTWREVVS